MKHTHTLAAMALAIAALGATGLAQSQVAGPTTAVGATITATTEVAMGWSAKKTLLGKTVVNDSGATVGKVQDLIISPDRNVSFVIVGAGGFVGIGRHDVAIPVSQIQNVDGKLVMAGATKETVKAMAPFVYADPKADRASFMAQADRDLARGRNDIAALQKKAGSATADAKAAMDTQVTALQSDMKAAETQLSEMKSAAASRWREFEAKVTAANQRLRKSIDKALA